MGQGHLKFKVRLSLKRGKTNCMPNVRVCYGVWKQTTVLR